MSVGVHLSLSPYAHSTEQTVACFFVKLTTHVNHDVRINPTVLEVRVQKSRLLWTNIEITL